ncbi:hypothetical protein KRX52_03465 [Pseudomonas sp. MAP12]|uniref:Lipocalin-like domain-containing protein n=1 Tax=Geopseudomonas aromaticivorans TaxID=2849492 RepID=A0ABS6MSS0_9GAMM|nr:hypothetical protein [Pseudomonas aromaticivorans]MBV2131853.1 hypothetical protein [Pseudomonas aromaticivorans]
MSEKIIWNGEKFDLIRIPKLAKNPKIKFTGDFSYLSTGCYRGYVGTWEIKDNSLFLNEISGIYEKTTEEQIFANWVSGEFIINQLDIKQKTTLRHRISIESGEVKNITTTSGKIEYQ